MKKLLVLLILLSSFFYCMPPLYYSRPGKSPHIRIGIVEDVEQMLFTASGALRVLNETGSPVGQLETGDWQVSIVDNSPADRLFFLKALTTKDATAAEAKMKKLREMGYPTFMRTLGRKLTFNSRPIVDNQIFVVYLEQVFINKTNAVQFQKKISGAFSTVVVQEFSGKPKGTIILKNMQNGKIFQFNHTIRLHDNPIILRDVPVGSGFHWESKETRKYTGIIEVNLARSGKITVINEIPVERYLRGVVPAEMPATFPAEALKAQAVAVRNIAFQKMGVSHIEQDYDVCDDVHCQVYRGILAEKKETDLAVNGTYGIVLTDGLQLCNTVYSAVCGGHTESSENVWSGNGVAYLKGKLDHSTKKYTTLGDYLKSEKNVRKWIEGEPTTFCNQKSAPLEALAKGSEKYFRWKISYSRSELENNIIKKTGQKIGKLQEIIPLNRGVSGRLSSIKIIGSSKSFILDGELKIRQALANSTLFSSCFLIETNVSGNFVLKGAGFGHGVGMCQYGAAGMALAGKNFQQILKHYYPGTKLSPLY